MADIAHAHDTGTEESRTFLGGIMFVLISGAAMFGGCLLAGSFPLVMSLQAEKVKLCNAIGAGLLLGTALSVIIPEGINAISSGGGGHDHDHDHEKNHGQDYSSYVGIILVAGFLLQFILEKVIFTEHGHSHGQTSATNPSSSPGSVHQNMATFGLVVHSAADGASLGASIVSSLDTSTEYMILLALMLHKAPAAFGLCSYLLANGLEKRYIRQHLLAFSLAAPVMAIITYVGLYLLLSNNSVTGPPYAGIALLFSGGTFLYVSTIHVFPELTKSPPNTNTNTNSNSGDLTESVMDDDDKHLTKNQIIGIVIGAMLPAILSSGHHH